MAVPDPQPPKPRGMSTARWLLLLTASLPMLFAPQIATAWSRAHDLHGERTFGPMLGTLLLTFAITAVLSIVLGVQMEKWKRGSVERLPRVVVYSLNILFTACFIAGAGCAVVSKFSTE